MKDTWFLFSFIIHSLTRISISEASGQCGSQKSFFGKALKGHVFATVAAESPDVCFMKCQREQKCQSFNYVLNENMCELSNRSKEAQPEQFVTDQERLYMTGGAKRVPLGSIPELPAESCAEIKASEGQDVVSGNWWLDSTGSGEILLAHCDMGTGAADFCLQHHCQNGATCVTNEVNYTCTCRPWWIGAYCESLAPGNFQSSAILKDFGSPVYAEDLTRFLESVVQAYSSYTWITCYHALTDGLELATAHSNCDNKGPTVTIVRVGDYIFGAYMSIPWISPCSYSADSEAFIFSLHSTMGYQPVKLTQRGVYLHNAVYRCSTRFISFGNGHDLHVSYPSSYTKPYAYYPPMGCSLGDSCTVFAGTFAFTPNDIEVFYLISS